MREIPGRVILIGAATLLGVVVVASGGYAVHGSLAMTDAPGQVLQVRGVGLGSAAPSPSATAQASPRATGPATATATTSPAAAQAAAVAQSGVNQVAPPAAQMLPRHREQLHSPEPAHSSSHR
ncbi:MAG: hypothetical protein ABI438_07810 [Dermatophilaceae bacterium]